MHEVGGGAIRRRVDGDVTASWRKWMIEGGAGVGSGQLLGTMRHLWANLEMPLPGALTLLVAAEHVRWDFTASRYLLFSESFELDRPGDSRSAFVAR